MDPRHPVSSRAGGDPLQLHVSPPAQAALQDHYASEDLEEALGLPIRMNAPTSIKPLYADPRAFGETVTDEFRVVWTTSPIDRGAPVGPFLAGAELGDYRFPDPGQEYRFAALGDWCQANRERYTILWVGDLWERATFMRGMQELLLDVAMNPRFVRRRSQAPQAGAGQGRGLHPGAWDHRAG